MSEISYLVLLGLIAQGFSNESRLLPLIPILLWLTTRRLKIRPFKPSPAWEAVIVLAGFLLTIFLAGFQEVHLFVIIGNGLAVVQILRMFRTLTWREKIASLSISLVQIAISSQVILGYGFILILLLMVYFLPRALAELEKARLVKSASPSRSKGHLTGGAVRARDYFILAATSILFFLFFPRFNLPQLLNITSYGPKPHVSRGLSLTGSNAFDDTLLMILQGESISRVRLRTLDTFDGRQWRTSLDKGHPRGALTPVPKYQSGDILPYRKLYNFPYDSKKLRGDSRAFLKRSVVILDTAHLRNGFLPVDGQLIYAEGNFFGDVFPTLGGTYRIATTRFSGSGKYIYGTQLGLDSRPDILSTARRRVYLEVPEFSERVRRLIRDITEGAETNLEKSYRLRNYLKSFSYEESVWDLNVQEGLANFLFVDKKGTCAHFASALALMLRACGIPSRIVVGYLVREKTSFGTQSQYNIRHKDAHAWVEAYPDEKGWRALDATPPSELTPAPGANYLSNFSQWAQYIWYGRIINFSARDQYDFFRRAILIMKTWWVRLFIGVILFTGLGWGWVLLRRFQNVRKGRVGGKEQATDIDTRINGPAQHFYGRMGRILETIGEKRKPAETPLEFSLSLQKKAFPQIKIITFITDIFCRVRYAGMTLQPGLQRAIKKSLRSLESFVKDKRKQGF